MAGQSHDARNCARLNEFHLETSARGEYVPCHYPVYHFCSPAGEEKAEHRDNGIGRIPPRAEVPDENSFMRAQLRASWDWPASAAAALQPAGSPSQERDFLSRIRRLTVEGRRAGEGLLVA